MRGLKRKIWVRLYLKIAAVFVAFVAVLFFANTNFMYRYYIAKEKGNMEKIAQKIDEVDLYSSTAASELSEIISDSNRSLLIYDSFGNTLFLSYDSPVANYKGDFDDKSERPETRKNKSGEESEYGFSQFDVKGSKRLRYTYKLSGGETLNLSTALSILENSAAIANEFITIVAICCLLITLVWVIFLSREIAKPIKEMNDIASRMANLDFSQKLTINTQDEVGRLANAINILSDNLNATLKDLEKKNAVLRDEIEAERRIDKMRKEFIANVSHELKTPISIISGYAEGLKLDIGNVRDRNDYANIISDEAARMNEMVLNLLDLSKLESGNSGITLSEYDIVPQIKDFVKKFSDTLLKSDVTVKLELPESMTVNADVRRIGDVLQNYISNAVSHVSTGGEIVISAKNSNGRQRISVYNDGKNIDYEDLEHIWESFYRGEKSHKRESDRFGLGLSIVKAIVEAHGGACGVYNTEKGVTFWFELQSAETVNNGL